MTVIKEVLQIDSFERQDSGNVFDVTLILTSCKIWNYSLYEDIDIELQNTQLQQLQVFFFVFSFFFFGEGGGVTIVLVPLKTTARLTGPRNNLAL